MAPVAKMTALRQESSAAGDDRYGLAGLDLEDLFSLKNLNVFQSMTDGDIDEGFAGNAGETRVVFHNRGDRDLPSQGAALHHHGLEAAADRVNAGSKPGRSAPHNHHIRFDQFRITFGNENRSEVRAFPGMPETALPVGLPGR